MRFRWNYFGALAFAWPLAALSLASGVREGFLTHPVSTTGDLVREIRSDEAVQALYIHHFGMSFDELSAYLWTLRPAHTSEDETVTVYSPTESGQTTARQELLRKNSAVFIDIHDKPVILAGSGSPLVLKPKRTAPVETSILSFDGSTDSFGNDVKQPAKAEVIGAFTGDADGEGVQVESVNPIDMLPVVKQYPIAGLTATPQPRTSSSTSSPMAAALSGVDSPVTSVQITDTSDPTITDAVNLDTRDLTVEPNPLPGTAAQIAPWEGGAAILAAIGLSMNAGSSKAPVVNPPASTPEPASLVLVAVGAGALLRRRSSRR